ncbi:integrins alpha chain like protein [Microcystis aeruginosa NIES-3787]|uniref:Integrins alpha chain like protein n=1 Tax=Microcystis aeruginosa NIES-3787 TaxID=2517782 RepID=A0A6H9FYN1_MICAE|nr:integrins alpha chain like protein [Microcystis aeruginosa NIES-3787]
MSQANQVNSARNQRLTATVVFLDAGVADYQSLQAGVIPEVATVILTLNQDGIEQISAFLQQNPQINTTTSIIKSVRYAIALHSLRVSKQLK